MAFDVMKSLFDLTPNAVQQTIRAEEEDRALTQARMLQGNPFMAAAYPALRTGERLLTGTQQLAGVVDPRMKAATDLRSTIQGLQDQGIDMATPEGMIALAGELNKNPDFAGMSLALRQQASQIQAGARKAALGEAKTISEIQKNIAQTDQAGRAKTPSVSEQVKTAKFNQLIAKYPDTPEGRAKAADEFAEWESSFRQKEAAASVPPPGEVKITDLGAAQGVVNQYVQKPKEKLDQIAPLRTTLAEAQVNKSGAAFEQVRGMLVKLVGDSQISQTERARITGSSGVIGDAINKINTLLTGIPTAEKLKEIDRMIAALEDAYGTKYNAGVDKAATVLKQGRLSPETQTSLLPSKYESGLSKQRQRPTFKEGQVYQDAAGNNAIYQNGTFVPAKLVNGKWTPVK